MIFTTADFLSATPEIAMLIMVIVIIFADLFCGMRYKNTAYLLTQITLAFIFILCWRQYGGPSAINFNGLYLLDNIAIIAKLGILIISFLVFVYSRSYVAQTKLPQGEYYLLGLFAILGMFVISSAASFLTLYLGLELLSLPLYAMVALQRDSGLASEAAMKYFIMGALASGMMLYGISMIYGATHSLNFVEIFNSIFAAPADHRLILVFGMGFIIVGIAFKLGVAPFHMWVPDVYEGAPGSVALFIGGAPKIAGFIIAIRILVETMPALSSNWQPLLIVLALLSIILGNLIAIVQTNIKRMLAYSSIAHMGYALLGLIAVTEKGFSSALFYVFSYSIMSTGALGMVVLLSKIGFEAERIQDFRGLNSRNPWLALMMLLIMFSMAGIPPTVGFFAKLGVLEAIINVHLIWLAATALLFSIVGAYYYLNIVKVMYFEEPEIITPVIASLDTRIAISINGLAILLLGLFPSSLINLCRNLFG